MNNKQIKKSEIDPGKITLLIPGVSDMFCICIRFLVEEIRDMQIIMCVSDCKHLRSFLDADSHCIIVTHYPWLVKSGIGEVKALLETYPDLKILMYLKPGEYSFAATLFQAGIKGFFSDSITREEFQGILSEISSGKSYFPQDIIPMMLDRKTEKDNLQVSGMITPREQEILELIVRGHTNKEIASKLFLSPRTIEGHRANLILKFGVRNTAELVSESMNMLDLVSV